MRLPVRFDEDAELEAHDAATRYEAESVGLGWAFLDAVDEAVTRIRENPAACSLVPGVPKELEARRALLHRFPYSVVFLRLPDEIRILAIAHGRRRPGYWRPRIRT